MNYVCAVYAAIGLIVALDWFVRARHTYHGIQVDGQVEGDGIGSEVR